MEMISQMSATPLESSDASLVAGNVTGGGGKATSTKTYWHRTFEYNNLNLFKLGADRGGLSAGKASGYKIGGSNVYMREPPTL